MNPFEKQRVRAFLILVVMRIVVIVLVARHGDGGRQSDQSAVVLTRVTRRVGRTRRDATRRKFGFGQFLPNHTHADA